MGPAVIIATDLTWEPISQEPRLPGSGPWFSHGLASFMFWVCTGWRCWGGGLRQYMVLILTPTSEKSFKCEQRMESISYFLGWTKRTPLIWPSTAYGERRGEPQMRESRTQTVSRSSKSMGHPPKINPNLDFTLPHPCLTYRRHLVFNKKLIW